MQWDECFVRNYCIIRSCILHATIYSNSENHVETFDVQIVECLCIWIIPVSEIITCFLCLNVKLHQAWYGYGKRNIERISDVIIHNFSCCMLHGLLCLVPFWYILHCCIELEFFFFFEQLLILLVQKSISFPFQ